jgi:integrase
MALKIEAMKRKGGKVLLRYAYSNKTRKYFYTGITIPISDFKEGVVQKPVRSSNPNAAHLNRQVDKVYSRIEKIRSQLILEGKEPTADLVNYLFNKVDVVSINQGPNPMLSQSFDRFLKASGYGAATEKLYKTLYTHLINCFGDIPMIGFDLDKWHIFANYLRGKELKANTICIRLSKFKHFIKSIKEDGIEVPIDKFPMPKEEIKKIALDNISLQKMRDYRAPNQSLEQIRDLCLFQCFTGLRVSDLMRLKKNHILSSDGLYRISMNAFKTNKPMFIPLSEEAHDLLAKYNYQLPVFAEPYYNRQLKILARNAGLDSKIEWLTYDEQGKKVYKSEFLFKLISSHACCRTAISYFMASYEPAMVCSILGKSMETIMKYYYNRSTEQDIIAAHQRNSNQNGYLRGA